ncbi:MAG: molecular chaperone DnaJ [Naasia sp.]|jgi:hypothetical protein|uniref:DnaJ family domain-containing protein n=1 Tax=Naasia sp. TaxID=2546198 RepID=UPI002622BDB3|nr:DUF1992 domain-containing protein [Naasia sp.]MCU1570806.1 molecular chaperone DnaJ [Naasia sp.]
MPAKRPRPDSRLAAARYHVDRLGQEGEDQPDQASEAGRLTPEAHGAIVEVAIQQALRRGDFDNLPGEGRPLPGLGLAHDPDWWIRRKIEREGLTGLGPPALTLRREDAELDARLDALANETAVRDLLTGFNARVVEARRQLLGGPPVVTAPRDVEREVTAWRERRHSRAEELERRQEQDAAALAAMSWRERRRARRGK